MAKQLKCPKCETQTEFPEGEEGTTLSCGECGTLLKIPGGAKPAGGPARAGRRSGRRGRGRRRGRNSGPSAPAGPAMMGAPKKGKGRTTTLFRKMEGMRGPASKGGMRPPRLASDSGNRAGGQDGRPKDVASPVFAILVCVGIVALVIGTIVIYQQVTYRPEEKDPWERTPSGYRKRLKDEPKEEATADTGSTPADAGAPKTPAPVAPVRAIPKPKGPGAGGKFVPPASFEKGARAELIERYATPVVLPIDTELNRTYEAMAAGGKVFEIVGDHSRWMPYAVHNLLSDEESIARTSYQALHEICAKIPIETPSGRNPIKIEYFNSSTVRINTYDTFGKWYLKNKETLVGTIGGSEARPGVARQDPNTANWNDLMIDLRAGGAYDEFDRPEGRAFAIVQAMGADAYPHIVNFIDNEDPGLGRAAVRVLNELTGLDKKLPNDETKVAIKAEYETWVQQNR